MDRNTQHNENLLKKNPLEQENNNINPVFRFKFNDEFCNELFKFSKIYQFDNLKDFKEAWKIWLEENKTLVDNEIIYLNNMGYDGDIYDKMYKSARYYYRKKKTCKNTPKKRRIYIKISKEFINEIDKHIISCMENNNFKPASNFDNFCEINAELIRVQINILSQNINSNEEIIQKLKKTYKNRYFVLTNKNY